MNLNIRFGGRCLLLMEPSLRSCIRISTLAQQLAALHKPGLYGGLFSLPDIRVMSFRSSTSALSITFENHVKELEYTQVPGRRSRSRE